LSVGVRRRLDQALREWAVDPHVSLVAIRGEGPRAFCAGGDIRALYDAGPGSSYTEIFYRHEYALNRRIFRFPKPYVALVDGIVMGGGVGVSATGSPFGGDARPAVLLPDT